ncbi:MAG: hypothetical protein M3P96_12750 [Actinomycetota bacterium]|nr:hypothetical protein [Actinomycetota bacterium]
MIGIGCPEAEAAFLGALLLAPPRAAEALVGVMEDDFTDPRHQVVFAAMVELVDQGVPADPVTLLGHLRRTGRLRPFTADREPGAFLIDLAAACPLPASVQHYRAVVLEHALLRRAHEAGERVQQAAEGGDPDVLLGVLDGEHRAVLAAAARLRAPLRAVDRDKDAA